MRFSFRSLSRLAPLVSSFALVSTSVFASQLIVSWDDNSTSETGFKVERSLDGANFTAIATVPADTTSFTDTGVVAATSYWYRVCAYNATTTSAYSNVTSGTVPATVTPVPPVAPVPGRLASVSAQAVSTSWGSGALRLDFGIVGGSKSMLLRGIGPGLAAYTTAALSSDPAMQLLDGSTVLNQNDNWGGSSTLSDTFQRVGAFAISSTSKDAAILTSLPAKTYSATVTGKNTGTAMAEIYDADATGTVQGRLATVYARGQVGKGAAALITGFVILGDTPLRVLVRAVGHSLNGLQGLLSNPQLDIYRGTTLLQHNDNWGGTSAFKTLFQQVGASTLSQNSTDSAIDITLAPGTYSAVVSGVNGTTGLARIEFYTIP